MAEGMQLGWRVGRFALERLVASGGESLTSVALWQAYRAWCAKAGDVPLAEAEFYGCFAALAEEVGMVARQVGGNISYRDMALQEGVADVDDRQAA